MTTKTYSVADVSVLVAGVPITNFADGTFVAIAKDVPLFTKKIGADGEVTRSRSLNKGGTIKITLNQASESNDYLLSIYKADEISGQGLVAVTVRDSRGITLAQATAAWIEKLPDVSYSKDVGDREWTFDTGYLELEVGGITK